MHTLDTAEIVLAVLALGPSLGCAIHLWLRRGVPLWKRALWTVFLAAPVIGPLFYGSIFHRLEPHGLATRPVKGQGGVPYPTHPGQL